MIEAAGWRDRTLDWKVLDEMEVRLLGGNASKNAESYKDSHMGIDSRLHGSVTTK
eukprot:CAMPEP_0115873168 /NCGR_PEP_ID=MMETSP0287-20121206/23846_1 /TAXON_ID=412157 /ORGANISM="Chrysochromulina rotalis, Strain UIO044" /LENGTH=54 /DNA_ID=CAMNT_0003328199 /DNA_START=273 /DNA_END=440 /DNA_ORIENTATION=-